jgi:hypothetical protein
LTKREGFTAQERNVEEERQKGKGPRHENISPPTRSNNITSNILPRQEKDRHKKNDYHEKLSST